MQFSRNDLPARGDYIFVGEAPGKDKENLPTFSGKVGTAAKLAKMIDLDQQELFGQLVWAVNVLSRWPGSLGSNGDAFQLAKARKNAGALLKNFPGRYLVLLGKRVAKAFEVADKPFFLWFPFNEAQVVIIPHPSGKNRWWNSRDNQHRATQFFTALKWRILYRAVASQGRDSVRL